MPTKTSSRFRARRRKRIVCPQITEYLRLVETGKYNACERQKKFAAYVRRVFATEELIIDTDRIDRYGRYLKYFPFDLFFPWEWCLFVLFTCVFRKDGTPRWTDLVCFVGRGAGKNGFIAFIAFCLVTVVNGIQNYDVDICANSEDQAKRSFTDIWVMLEGKFRTKFRKGFRWNRVEIVNRSTNSTIKYRTNSPKSKDGMRSGLVVFDEVHAYTNWKNITVFTTGQGKCDHPRRAFISSNGDIRDGVYDALLERCDRILNGEVEDDNGYLPFVCSLDDPSEVHDERNWPKANPSLPYMPVLWRQIRKEYKDWCDNPAENADFMTKRMGVPQGDTEFEVTSWENLKRASRPNPSLEGKSCVLGLDFSRKDDFLSAVLLFRDTDEGGEETYHVIHHSWFCLYSRDRHRIRPPIEEWAKQGLVSLVDKVEIPTRDVVDWIEQARQIYTIEAVALDDYRYDIVHKELEALGYSIKEKTITKVRPSDHMRVQPIIHSAFNTGRITWGEDPAMRWFTNNTKLVPFLNGNYKYEKIEPRSRKTDGFMALVAAMCIREQIPEEQELVFLPMFTF